MCRRVSIALTAVAALASASVAGEAIPAAQAQAPDHVERDVLLEATKRASALLDLSAHRDGSAYHLTIKLDGTPALDVIPAESGRALTLEFYDTVDLLPRQDLERCACPYVSSIRTQLRQLEPRLVSRVALDLARPCTWRVERRRSEFTLILEPSRASFEDPMTLAERIAAFRHDLTRRLWACEIAESGLRERLARTDARRLGGDPAALLRETLADLDDAAEATAHAVEALREQLTAVESDWKAGRLANDDVEGLLKRLEHLSNSAKPVEHGVLQLIAASFEHDLRAVQAGQTGPFTVAQLNQALNRVAPAAEPVPAAPPANRQPSGEQAEPASFAVPAAQAKRPTPRRVELDALTAQLTRVSGKRYAGPGKLSISRDLHPRGSIAQRVAELRGGGIRPTSPPPTRLVFHTMTRLAAVGEEEGAGTGDAPSPLPDDQAEDVDALLQGLELESEEPAIDVDDAPRKLLDEPEDIQESEAATVTPVKDGAPAPADEPAPRSPAPRRELPVVSSNALQQRVNIKFQNVPLSSVVSLLAHQAGINVIAGEEVAGKSVTADIQDIPLKKGIELVLRMNDLGIVEEEGIYLIVPYEQAVAARRMQRLIPLKNADAVEVKEALSELTIGPEGQAVTVAADRNSNSIILSGAKKDVLELEELVLQLDSAESALPTKTEALRINYADLDNLQTIVDGLLTDETGSVQVDQRGRHLVVTDYPAVIEEVRNVVTSLDIPSKEVSIEAMIVDAVMEDGAQTGVDWFVDAVRERNTRGQIIGSLQNLTYSSALGTPGTDALNAAVLSAGILTDDIDLQATIAAEVASRNAKILARPVIVVAESETGMLSIVQEFPYQEFTQGLEGSPVATTAFKDIGVQLEVTPSITHNNDIRVEMNAKQSSVGGLTETGVPIEDKREAETTLRTKDGRTVFIGGLRNISDRLQMSKVPVLGDVPGLNIMFRDSDTQKIHTELLIFLTCRVIEIDMPELTAKQQLEYDALDRVPRVPDAQKAMFRSYAHPEEMRDPVWKWRRPE